MKKLISKILFLSILFTPYVYATVYEDAESLTIEKWEIYDANPVGATVSNIYDADKQSNVIELNGTAQSNGYVIGHSYNDNAWKNTEHKIFKWSMNYSENFELRVVLDTNKGSRYIVYSARNNDIGLSGNKIYQGLGSDAKNGTWQTFTRDLEADLKEYESDNELIAINAFLIRGSGRFDDIQTLAPEKITYEDAENEDTSKWDIFDNNPVDANISNIYDEVKQSNVIEFIGSGTSNGYRIGHSYNENAWRNTDHKIIRWSMNYSENFEFRVVLDTSKGSRYIVYSARDNDIGLSGSKIYQGLGSDAKNGTWQTFTRDLEADLQEYESDNSIIAVNSFLIRGNGRIDDISMLETPEIPKYYVDATNGNDNNNGLSKDSALKTLTRLQNEVFLPGDVIAFKKGETWIGRFIITNSGESNNPIVFTSYGDGDTKPVISGNDVLTGAWENNGTNKWRMHLPSVEVTRLWVDGNQEKRCAETHTGHTWDEFGSVCSHIWDDEYLYYYSNEKPTSTFVGQTIGKVFSVVGGSYIDIKNIDVQGGNDAIYLKNTDSVTISHNNIGKNSSKGIDIQSTNNLLVENNIIDSNAKLIFSGIESFSGTDQRGIGDGLGSYGGLTNSQIRNNNFLNWGHSGVAFTNAGDNPITDNKIYNNYFTADNLEYGRAIGYSGNGVQNNEIYRNYLTKLHTKSQLGGVNNHFHHNWIKDIFDTPYKNGAEGQGITISCYSNTTSVTGNIIEFNTFEDIDDAGIELRGYNLEERDVSNNTINKNLFINCGRNAKYSSDSGKGIVVKHYQDIRDNNFYDNAFISSGKAITHRNVEVTTDEFNSRDGVSGDNISANTTEQSDQGAGDITLHNIGATQ